ncbi:LysR family transcriptional regulator [Phytoactinopolyspora halotolerans]|uniref:LysR family transcriptional regulator n=1 Tax=Phytoactinopolyspora halotolerans TaxID=1981512 RepID=A0A6L9SGY4_9ACTN|nr:LysR family transcriptional regulator [Phytoactinopolyspora halotolerans]NEE03672.1 LysR family transcriptional regulator [Phytoactinopolyspora halotolerans]
MHLSSAYGYRLDWIASFVAVAREGGFSAAARAQFRSQPRVSSHVSDLERALGTKLFDRSVHPAALTPEGRALLPHAEEILVRLGVFADVVAEAGGQPRGEVHVGMYPSAAAFLYPDLVRQLRQETPDVTTVLREGDTLALEQMLAGGEVDVAVRPLLPLVSDDRLHYRRLWREPLVAALPADGHPRGGGTVELSSLDGPPLITIGEPTGNTRQFETNLAFAEAGVQPNIAFQTNQPQTLAALVRAGLGIGVTNMLAMTTADCSGVVLAAITGTRVERQVAVWWRSDRTPSTAARRVIETIAALSPDTVASRQDADAEQHSNPEA